MLLKLLPIVRDAINILGDTLLQNFYWIAILCPLVGEYLRGFPYRKEILYSPLSQG